MALEMKHKKAVKLSHKVKTIETPLATIELYDGSTWQTLASESYVDAKALQTAWDLLNDDTEVIWQQL